MKKCVRAAMVIVALISMAVPVYAHLCNDVFIQAKDNLAVKVDIRDNQLRINDSAEFRVYLLNTMDRDIADIRLAIDTDQFDTTVTPASDWRSYPKLRTKNKGGKKEYFTVTLERKSGTEQGTYKIGLRLYNGRDDSMVFKTLDINEAMCSMEIPHQTAPVNVDGTVEKSEWKDSLLCTSLYEYVYEPITMSWISEQAVNKPSDVQTRFRFNHDGQNLYGMIDFQTSGNHDIAQIYISPDHDSVPKVITANLQQQTVSINGSPETPLPASFSGTKIEFSVPLDKLGLAGKDSFYANVTRNQDDTKTYWHGNDVSVLDPIVYANFVLKK